MVEGCMRGPYKGAGKPQETCSQTGLQLYNATLTVSLGERL